MVDKDTLQTREVEKRARKTKKKEQGRHNRLFLNLFSSILGNFLKEALYFVERKFKKKKR